MAKAIRRVALLLTFSLLILTSTVGVANSQAGNGKYDTDGDRLIEVSHLEQLDAIRLDLDGDGIPDSDVDANKYADAFPTAETETVCGVCNGYELTRSLNFDIPSSYASGAVNTAWTTGSGWDPIGYTFDATFDAFFDATFDGNGHTVNKLYISRPETYSVGLFFANGSDGVIRNIGVVDVDITGQSGGGLAGVNQGTISDSYSTGSVEGSGGLVGRNGVPIIGMQHQASINRSYSSADVSGRQVGGLAEENFGTITFSHATGSVSGSSGGAAGGLVSGNQNGTIRASYATGTVSGGDPVGGLAGYNLAGNIDSSYATGRVEARDTGTAGGLVGSSLSDARITGDAWIIASYATGSVKGGVKVGGLVGILLHPSWYRPGGYSSTEIGVAGSYATGSVEGNIQVGGLIGAIHERSDADQAVTITASYATGSVEGNSHVGGLIGGDTYHEGGSTGGITITSSYWDTQTSGQTTGVGSGDSGRVQGMTTTQLQSPTGYTGIYSNWDVDLDNADGDNNDSTGTDDFWDFGTGSQYPALKADLDGNGTPTWQEFGSQRGNLPTFTTPEAPTGLTATAQGPTQINLSWSATSDGGGAPITAYHLRHIETGAADKSDANWTVKEDVWTTGSGPLQYSLTGLNGGTEYDVQVRAVNAAGESEWSATVTGTTAPPAAPEAPTGLTARVVSGEARVVLSWTAPANTGGAPITGYKIEASDDGSTSWTEVYTTTGDATGYTDEGDDGNGPMFEVGTMRYYRVSAINSVGTGAASNAAKAEDLVARYDANNNSIIEKNEVINAINDYLFGQGDEAISKSEVIKLINLYLFG